MKYFIVFLFLMASSSLAHGQQLRINNNTGCDIAVDVYVWDVPCSIPSSTGHYLNYTILSGQSLVHAGAGTTQEYEVDITVDPTGTPYAMPRVTAAGICNPDNVTSAPNTPCGTSPTVAVPAAGSSSPNWEIDVN